VFSGENGFQSESISTLFHDRCPEKKLIKLEDIKKMIIDKSRKEKKRRGKKIKNKKQANSTL